MANHLSTATANLRFVDALDRAWRTFYSLVGVDLLITLGTGLNNILNDNEPFTGTFWNLVIILLIKSVLGAVASFMLRYARAPKVPTPPVDTVQGLF